MKLKGVTNCTRGVFSYLKTLLTIFHFGLLCNVATLALNVATLAVPPLERRDVRSQRRDVSFALLWNIATLDLDPLCHVATLDPNVATLAAPPSGTPLR